MVYTVVNRVIILLIGVTSLMSFCRLIEQSFKSIIVVKCFTFFYSTTCILFWLWHLFTVRRLEKAYGYDRIQGGMVTYLTSFHSFVSDKLSV